ncbi:MAG: hypothetical protein ACI94Y_002966 [Maribacter sp.]|jgi:hypothetical protein
MNTFNFKYIFQNSLDTFKVFETLPIDIYGILIEGHSKTIWQTLNHLIIWRNFQILKMKDINANIHFNESDSWITGIKPNNEEEWKLKINEFDIQTKEIKSLILNLNSTDIKLNEKLKLIQDSSTHLSFHLGEIILIARQKNKYPKPSEMNIFLKKVI